MRIIGGSLGGRRIDIPKNFKSRPTTDIAREALFNILSNRYSFDELTVLDLFSGTGSIIYEFYSRGTTDITGIELDKQHFEFIKRNIYRLQISGTTILMTDVLKFINKSHKKHFDLIFADPPFDFKNRHEIIEQIFDHELLKPNGILILEHSPEDNYEKHRFFCESRHYGRVNFSFFEKLKST